MSKTFLITAALPYVNNIPHLGNLIGSTLSGDVLARYKRMTGNKVLYLCGSDCYGTASEMKARQEKTTPREVCEKYHKIHESVYKWFNISFDVWGTTMTDTQTALTHEIFNETYKNGHIEEKEIDQMYCKTCDLFLADRFLQGICYHKDCEDKKSITNGDQCDTCGNMIDIDSLVDYWCYECKTKPSKVKTKHLFLKLGDFQDELRDKFITNKKCKMNANAISITKAWLDRGLESRCITRDLKWGTSVPAIPELTDYKNKVFYVWYDAPFGYYSILKHAREDWKDWLGGEIINCIGKDNIFFHSAIFPISLMASSNIYPCVTQICSTDYLMYEGTKFSKSKGVGIFGDNVQEISTLLNIDEDYWRYYLIKIRPETKDSNFSWKEFVLLIKAELCSKVGNFINRCMSLTEKYFPDSKFTFDPTSSPIITDTLTSKIAQYCINFDNDKLRDALNIALEVADVGNGYIQETKPWDLIKTDEKATHQVLGTCLYVAYVMLTLLKPFIPNKAELLLKNIVAQHEYNIFVPLTNLTIVVNKTNYKIPFVQITLDQVKDTLEALGIK